MVKNDPAKAGERRDGFDPWVGKIPWRRGRQHTPFLPGESHGFSEEPGQLYSPWGCQELDTTEAT